MKGLSDPGDCLGPPVPIPSPLLLVKTHNHRRRGRVGLVEVKRKKMSVLKMFRRVIHT